MENLSIYAPRLITRRQGFAPGHRACSGCGESLAVNLVMKVLGRNTIVSMSTGCMEVISTQLPRTAWEVPWIHTLFETSAIVASGIEAGLKALTRKGATLPETKVVAMGGDGATFDIGLGPISGAFERGHDFIYVCYDNEAYMNTGIQRSSATPFGASTTTQPAGKVSMGQPTWKKNMPAIAVAHNIPYVATACPSYPFDLMRKVKKAAEIEGPTYVHILSVCPTGWRIPTDMTIRIGRLAVETGVFPLYEVENGKYTLSYDPPLRPVEDYLKSQGRFRHLTAELIDKIQQRVTAEYAGLKKKVDDG